MDEREKMARGLLYDANHNPDLIKERAMCKDMCFAYNSLRPSDEEGKRKIAERLFGRIGRAFSVLAPFYCDYGYNIFCGDDFFANHNCVMLDGAKITFGEHVYIAPNCCFARPVIRWMPGSGRRDLNLPAKSGSETTYGSVPA